MSSHRRALGSATRTKRHAFASIVLAADTLGIASPTQIADVCNGRGAAMGGFSWRFAKGKKKQKLSDKKQLRF